MISAETANLHVQAQASQGLLKLVLAEIRADLWFYVSVAAYVLAAAILAAWLGAEAPLRPFLYMEGWTTRMALLILMIVPAGAIVAGIARDPRSPLRGIVGAAKEMLSARFLAGCLMLAVLPVFYGTFTSIKNMLPLVAPFGWDPMLADVDRALHGGVDPGLALRRLFGLEVTLALDSAYALVWFFLLIGVSVWAALSTGFAHLRRRYFLTLVLAWVLIGNLLAGAFLSAGPCFYAEVTGDTERFSELVDSMVGRSAEYKRYLWDLHVGGRVDLGTGISAFPSMHIAIATLIALYLWSVSRILGGLGVAFLAAMLCGSVLLGWHYAIDGYASIAITGALWSIAGSARLAPRSSQAAEWNGTGRLVLPD